MENVERIRCGNNNCYIISNGENAILVDTCQPKYRAKILDACKKYKMRLLLLTHGHMDHVQNAAYLSRELHIPIAMNQADVELIHNNMVQSLEAKTFLGKIVLAFSIKSFHKDSIPVFTPTILLSDGDMLSEYGICAQIVGVPGHTNGSIAVDVREKDFIVGDALMNMFYPTVSMLYHNRADMLKSAEKIGRIGDRTIYFGHGKPVRNKSWIK